jgi:NUDIX domain.
MEKKHGPWTIKETTRKFQNEFMEVNEDAVIQPDGKPGRYATVKMKRGVSVLPLDEEGFVYLTRQFRYAVGQESIECVSGGVDDEEEFIDGARREALEEAGISAAEWIDLGTIDIDTSIVNCPAGQFLARGLKFTKPSREGTEEMQTIKVSLHAAVEMVLDGRITHGPSCILILKASEYLRGKETNWQHHS